MKLTLILWILGLITAGSLLSCVCAQQPISHDLTVITGGDPDSSISYVRVILPAERAEAVSDSPALTVECLEINSKKRMDIYLDFGGADRSFHPPAKPDPVTHFPPSNPSVRLKLVFEGYKPFNRTWEVMPSGEYRYRQPGIGSPNLDGVQFFLLYMYSVPVMHVSFTDPKASAKTAEFHTSGLMAEMRKQSLCMP